MRKIFKLILASSLSLLLLPQYAWAFWCAGPSGTDVDIQYVDINAFSLNKSITDTLISNMSNHSYCYGQANYTWYDALKITSITLSPKLTALGFSGYAQPFGGSKSAPPSEICIWLDKDCSVSSSASAVYMPVSANIGMKRDLNSGIWNAGAVLEAGDEVARITTIMRAWGNYNDTNWHNSYTWIFRVNAKMTIPAYTCNIVTPYDQTIVNLPSVSRADLVGNGTGRYANANKEFKFNLSCDAGTKVSVKVEGDTMTGQDTVLENKISGNPDVGIQLLYNNTTVVKPYETLKLVDSASAGQQLFSFNAYYFTKSTSVTGGLVKASATFWFDYQ
ncbi:fimbrial protein [Phytobacter ursingii]